jgi:hypothetical protein
MKRVWISCLVLAACGSSDETDGGMVDAPESKCEPVSGGGCDPLQGEKCTVHEQFPNSAVCETAGTTQLNDDCSPSNDQCIPQSVCSWWEELHTCRTFCDGNAQCPNTQPTCDAIPNSMYRACHI